MSSLTKEVYMGKLITICAARFYIVEADSVEYVKKMQISEKRFDELLQDGTLLEATVYGYTDREDIKVEDFVNGKIEKIIAPNIIEVINEDWYRNGWLGNDAILKSRKDEEIPFGMADNIRIDEYEQEVDPSTEELGEEFFKDYDYRTDDESAYWRGHYRNIIMSAKTFSELQNAMKGVLFPNEKNEWTRPLNSISKEHRALLMDEMKTKMRDLRREEIKTIISELFNLTYHPTGDIIAKDLVKDAITARCILKALKEEGRLLPREIYNVVRTKANAA
jgi:hypothetical protein